MRPEPIKTLINLKFCYTKVVKTIAFLILITILSCKAVPTTQSIELVMAHKKYPVDIYLDSQASKAEELVLIESIKLLEKETKRSLFNYLGRIKDHVKSKDGLNVVYFYKENDLRPEEQGRTSVFFKDQYFSRTKLIVEFDIVVNKRDFQFSYSDLDIKPNQTHLKSLLIHELGHGLGLTHSSNRNSIMGTNLLVGEPRLSFLTEDLNKIRSL